MAAARTRSRFDREGTRPRNDVYTGLLAISLVAMIVSCVLLYLDYSQYAGKAAPPVPPPPQPRPVATGQLPPPWHDEMVRLSPAMTLGAAAGLAGLGYVSIVERNMFRLRRQDVGDGHV